MRYVYIRQANELLIDLDRKSKITLPVPAVKYESRTAGHSHVFLRVNRKITDLEASNLQELYNSDSLREFWVRVRIFDKVKNPILLISDREYPVRDYDFSCDCPWFTETGAKLIACYHIWGKDGLQKRDVGESKEDASKRTGIPLPHSKFHDAVSPHALELARTLKYIPYTERRNSKAQRSEAIA